MLPGGSVFLATAEAVDEGGETTGKRQEKDERRQARATALGKPH